MTSDYYKVFNEYGVVGMNLADVDSSVSIKLSFLNHLKARVAKTTSASKKGKNISPVVQMFQNSYWFGEGNHAFGGGGEQQLLVQKDRVLRNGVLVNGYYPRFFLLFLIWMKILP